MQQEVAHFFLNMEGPQFTHVTAVAYTTVEYLVALLALSLGVKVALNFTSGEHYIEAPVGVSSKSMLRVLSLVRPFGLEPIPEWECPAEVRGDHLRVYLADAHVRE